jgi:hypothetical protein
VEATPLKLKSEEMNGSMIVEFENSKCFMNGQQRLYVTQEVLKRGKTL